MAAMCLWSSYLVFLTSFLLLTINSGFALWGRPWPLNLLVVVNQYSWPPRLAPTPRRCANDTCSLSFCVANPWTSDGQDRDYLRRSLLSTGSMNLVSASVCHPGCLRWPEFLGPLTGTGLLLPHSPHHRLSIHTTSQPSTLQCAY